MVVHLNIPSLDLTLTLNSDLTLTSESEVKVKVRSEFKLCTDEGPLRVFLAPSSNMKILRARRTTLETCNFTFISLSIMKEALLVLTTSTTTTTTFDGLSTVDVVFI